MQEKERCRQFQERAGETENHLQNEGNVAIAEETRDDALKKL